VQGNYLDYLGSENDGTTALSRLESSNKQAVAGVSLVVPLYQGGRPGALARQSVARESRAIEDAIATERDVIAQTRSAFASWQASLQSIESTRKAVSASSLSLEGVKAENSVGTRTIIDILDAEREALNAQVQFVTAQRNAYVAGFTLLASMGHAEARDLNLDAGPLYDPVDNYKRVRSKFLDWQFDPAPKPQATRTADTPTQTSVQIPGALDTLLPVAAERVSVPTPASTSGSSPRK
jgi:outer membrane protein